MENKIEEEIKLNDENNRNKNDKILLNNLNEKSDVCDAKNINDKNNKEDIENKNTSNTDKVQILQDKLKKIFIGREANKYKYNIVNIPDNLKYSSDNSNSSTPKKNEIKPKINNKKDVNKENDKNEKNQDDNKNNEINKEVINKNNLEIHSEIEKNQIIKEEKKSEKINEEDKYKNENKDNNNNNNNINMLDNKIIKNTENNNNKEYNKEDNNNDTNNNNSLKDNDNNKNNNNIIERNQTCKNYVIKRIPERKKNKNINKKNDEELKNRTFSMGFINHRKKNNSINKNNEKNEQINSEKKNEKEIEISNNNNNEKIENEEEKNKRLYRLLMAKKLGSSHNIIKHNIQQVIDSKNEEENQNQNQNNKNEKEISDKNNRAQSLKNSKKENPPTEVKKDIIKIRNDDNNLLLETKNKKDRSKTTIKVNTSKEIKAKEGALKILELIKAKKSEKNLIEQKKKETQEIIKKAKSQPVDFTESNSTLVTKEEENLEKKNSLNLSVNKLMQIKEKNLNFENDKNIIKNDEQIDKKEEKIINEIQKKVYKRFKVKSSALGNNNNMNMNMKNEFDNEINNKLKSNKKVKFIGEQNNEFIKNEFKVNEKLNINLNKYSNRNTLDNKNGYKTDIEEINKNKINLIGKNEDNNIILNSEEKIRRQKLENDLAAEINKDELSGRENNKYSKNKFINRNNTTINISNKQYYIPNNKKPKIQINQPNNSVINYSQKKIDNSNNLKDLNLFKNQNEINTYTNTNINIQNNRNFYANTKNKKYEQIKTYQNPKKTLDNFNKNINLNKSLKNQNILNKIYAPKKCHLLSKGKTKNKDSSLIPFSPSINYSNINEKNRSPQAFMAYNDKMTYIKKNLSNIYSSKKDNHKLNNSLGNIPSSINNNFDINAIIKNKKSAEIDSFELKHRLNSSFQMKINLDKNEYNTGNIFNQDYDNKNINLNSSYNTKFFQENLSKINKSNNLDKGYNTFYVNNNNNNNNNNNKFENTYTDKKSIYKSYNNNYNTKYDSDINFGTIANSKNNINSIYNNKNENTILLQRKYENNNYNNINILNNININNYQINLYDTLKYEDLLILEDKLINIMISLDNEKIISNECFDYWNYFFNCSFYENINKIVSNYDIENKNLIKSSINYNLMSIILSYDTSFDKEKLDKIRPLLLEMLELCHKILIITYEFILNTIKNNSNNIWIKKLYHLINSSKLSDGSETLFIESSKLSEKEKMKYNINFLMQKIYYILYNYPSTFSQSYLMSLFKKIQNKSYEDINDFFLEYILREKDIKYSILAFQFLKSGEIITPKPYPYLNYISPKNYTLILDIDETLFHFKINEDDDEQGVLKIRPGVFQFIDEIKEYYEIILFSEADKNYIDLITEVVGENRYLYDYVLCRDYVTIVGQNFVKELSKIGRPLDKIIIIDNMPQNFSFNKENGIYIKSFWGEENDDKALIDLIPILVNIAISGKDVRKELVKYKEKIVTKISSNIYKHNSNF